MSQEIQLLMQLQVFCAHALYLDKERLFVSKNFHQIFVRTESKFIGFKPFVQGCKGIIQAVLEVARHRYLIIL